MRISFMGEPPDDLGQFHGLTPKKAAISEVVNAPARKTAARLPATKEEAALRKSSLRKSRVPKK